MSFGYSLFLAKLLAISLVTVNVLSALLLSL